MMLLQKTKQISSQIPSQTHKFQTVSGLRSGFVCLSDRKVPVTFFFRFIGVSCPLFRDGKQQKRSTKHAHIRPKAINTIKR